MRTPCIIELRANEFARRRSNPHVPYGPSEVVKDALTGRAAGASILHWHARDAETGRPRNEIGDYASVVHAVRGAGDLLLHPTLGYVNDQEPDSRTATVRALGADPGTAVDLAPIDFGSMNVDVWDSATRRFASEDRVYLNSRGALRRTLELLRDADTRVVSVCWTPGQIRSARCFRELGLLGPTLWQLVFTGGSVPDGMPPTRRALEAMIEQVPSGEPWTVLTTQADPLELIGHALELGGHVSTGLGDWAFPSLGVPTNSEVVQHIARMVREAGRSVATPEQARAMLGIPSRANSPNYTVYDHHQVNRPAVTWPSGETT